MMMMMVVVVVMMMIMMMMTTTTMTTTLHGRYQGNTTTFPPPPYAQRPRGLTLLGVAQAVGVGVSEGRVWLRGGDLGGDNLYTHTLPASALGNPRGGFGLGCVR